MTLTIEDTRLKHHASYNERTNTWLISTTHNVDYYIKAYSEINVRMHGRHKGGIVLWGPCTGTVTRSGAGDGLAERAGSGTGDAIRSGTGNGHAIRSGTGDGTPYHSSTGSGEAKRKEVKKRNRYHSGIQTKKGKRNGNT